VGFSFSGGALPACVTCGVFLEGCGWSASGPFLVGSGETHVDIADQGALGEARRFYSWRHYVLTPRQLRTEHGSPNPGQL
jgi:hypothetical protein